MPIAKDWVGLRFGRLVVTHISHKNAKGVQYFAAKCDCGNTTTASGGNLSSKQVTSCGCYQKQIASERMRKYEVLSKQDRTYTSWLEMKKRCQNKAHKSYADYGGRGITVCDRWQTFDNFLADMGPRPLGTSIDRIDGTLGYFPGNCRWATNSEQAHNRNHPRWNKVTIEGIQYKSMSAAAKALGVSVHQIKKGVFHDHHTNRDASPAPQGK
jgi:hypothetical protein